MHNLSFQLLLLTLMTFALAACFHESDAEETFPFEPFDPGIVYQSDQVGKRLEVITNQESFEEIFHAVHESSEALPEINFEEKIVIAVLAGERPSSGYSIEIDRIEEGASALIISVVTTKPGDGCVVNTVITYPYHFVQISKIAKEILFKETLGETTCE